MFVRSCMLKGSPDDVVQGPSHVFVDPLRILQTGLQRYATNGIFADVVILTPVGKRIRAHQLVLAACSKKFAQALESGTVS